MNEDTIKQLVSVEVARQVTSLIPTLRSEIATTLEQAIKPLKADIIELSQNVRTSRVDLSIGRASMQAGPTQEELRQYLPEKLRQTSLRDVVREVASSYGVEIDDQKQWGVYAGLNQPSVSQLASRGRLQ